MLKTSLILFITFLLACVQNVAAAARHEDVTEDSLHYALHAVHPHFKDGVFTSNQEAMEVLEREDRSLASKVYALAKRQSNGTATTSQPTSPPPTQPPPTTPSTPQSPNTPPQTQNTPADTATTPYVTTSTSSFETVVTSPNGQRSTYTTFLVVVATATPSGRGSNPQQSTTGNPSLQSFGVRSTEYPKAMMVLLLSANVLGWLMIL